MIFAEIQGKLVAQLEQNELLASHLPAVLVAYTSDFNLPKIIPSILTFVIIDLKCLFENSNKWHWPLPPKIRPPSS